MKNLFIDSWYLVFTALYNHVHTLRIKDHWYVRSEGEGVNKVWWDYHVTNIFTCNKHPLIVCR